MQTNLKRHLVPFNLLILTLFLLAVPASAEGIEGKCVMYCDDSVEIVDGPFNPSPQQLADRANDAGNYLFRNGDYAGALAKYNQALKYAPNDNVIRRNLESARAAAMATVRQRQDTRRKD